MNVIKAAPPTPRPHRIKYIDIAKCLAIFFVCLGHSLQYLGEEQAFWNNPLWCFIYSFHMPLFMVLCGFFFNSSDKLSLKGLVLKKATQLIVPSLVWYTGFKLLFCLYKGDFSALFHIDTFVESLKFFWFLTSTFACYLLAYCSKRLFSRDLHAAIASLFLVSLLPAFNFCFISFTLPFFWVGYFLCKYQLKVNQHRSTLRYSSLFLFVLLLLVWDSSYTIYRSPIDFLHFTAPYLDLYNLGTALYRFAIGLCGSLFFILVSQEITDKWDNKLTTGATSIGVSTLGIYIIQRYTLEMLLQKAHPDFSLPEVFILAIPIAVAEVLACWVIVQLINRNNVLKSVLLGGYKWKKLK